ncbi:MAG TPA: hypothetical protein VNU68_04750 [Verrucomicrobiae bacterium]|nr:hypothetical protein [Verrucomicrobiae bacterium]
MNPSISSSAPVSVGVAVPLHEAAFSVVLRDEETGAFLAREPVGPADLVGHANEAWRDGCLRKGCPGLSRSQVPLNIRAVLKQNPASPSPTLCAGFGIDIILPDGRVTTTAFTVHSLSAVAARASEHLVALGKLNSGQTYTYQLHCQSHLRPREPVAAPPVELEFDTNDRSPALSWLEMPLRPLLQQATPHDDIPEAGFQVFFTAAAFARAEQFARKGAVATPPVETGAVLLGVPCSCPDTGEFFVVVTDAYEVIGAEQKVFSLGYTDRSWNRIQAVVKARQKICPAFRLLGQAHGHNFLPAGGKTCEACPSRLVCDLTNIYASQDDESWTRAVFAGAPYALCLIFGLTARADRIHGLFTQRDARLRQRGYLVLEHFSADQWPCRSGVPWSP